MNALKKGLYFVAFVMLAIIAYIIYDGHFSSVARIGKRNVANAKSLKVGMDENSVIEIMGKPNVIIQKDKATKLYEYTTNNVDYLDIEIYFDENGYVYRIFLPEN